jgi:hypothetical protein
MQTILANGTTVQLNYIDYAGLCGRDSEFSPVEVDLGAQGEILSNRVEVMDENMCRVDGIEGMLPGAQSSDEDLVMYTVQLVSGRILHLASYELELVR